MKVQIIKVASPEMATWIFYVDESYDNQKLCLSAIAIRHSEWKNCFRLVREHRDQLKRDFGFRVSKEIHARDFVAGRGNYTSKPIGKWHRSRIFFGILELIASLPKVYLINVCIPNVGKDPQLKAWDRLINRIERTMAEYERKESLERKRLIGSVSSGMPPQDLEKLSMRLLAYSPRAIIVADEGREHEITRAVRKMSVYNPVPSQFNQWSPGETTKNIITERIIEDPIFKQSSKSFFIQLADCVAFALLKREVPPTPNIQKYDVHKMFEKALTNVCFKKAHLRDPLGIVRS